jgi:SNF2 family DNA or RNA helicase
LFEAESTKEGKIKNPLKSVNPLDFIWQVKNVDEIKFYTSLLKFQQHFDENDTLNYLEALKIIVKNPLQFSVFYHDNTNTEKINAASVMPIHIQKSAMEVSINIDFKTVFHEIEGQLVIHEKSYNFRTLTLKFDYFIQLGNTLHLVDNQDFLRVIGFFKRNNDKILIHKNKFNEFKINILDNLEDRVRIRYSYIRPATKAQLEAIEVEQYQQKIIYLSELENYVLISPVMKYGSVEVPILSQKQVYATDHNGNVFQVNRDEEAELDFTTSILTQHPDFEEQLNQPHFYLPKQHFLNEDWFLNTFDTWTNKGIQILGFNTLKDNKLSAHRIAVSVNVVSGINWFDASLSVTYGKQKVSLNVLQKSIRNRNKYVQLGDGTLGLLPQEWIQKFAQYFEAGQIFEDKIRTPKSNFTEITSLYEQAVLSNEVIQEIDFLNEKFQHFEAIEAVEIPARLQATLRDYQKQGLNWLNFLDEFNFGGCLADDMGLGKTLQIIAFILSQSSKRTHNTNLVIVPTSLIFNWQNEVAKFAPSLKILTIYGANRYKNSDQFDDYEIVLTSYGTLLSDIGYLKNYQFNYIFLDESQAIKNPSSQRYKAACSLVARNKIVMTGTPIENNTFDIYGQLSFVNQGLLGDKQYFKDHYSTPIDKFEDVKRAKELRQKINPFILRRTKKQVAKELPEKTEIVIYCEMGAAQRKVYNAYEKEFRDYLNTKLEGDIPRESMHILQGLTKLRQICDSPVLLNDEQFYGHDSAKIDALMEQIENKSTQHKILVFSQFVTMLDLIKKELKNRTIPFEYLTGQTRNRAEKVSEFQENSEIRVFLISLKAGGTGLNLTEADYVYLVDPWWNPAVENQAIDRCYRIGQQKNVVAVRLICPDTIEEKIMQLQVSKKELANDLIKTDATMLKSLSKTDLLALLGK